MITSRRLWRKSVYNFNIVCLLTPFVKGYASGNFNFARFICMPPKFRTSLFRRIRVETCCGDERKVRIDD